MGIKGGWGEGGLTPIHGLGLACIFCILICLRCLALGAVVSVHCTIEDHTRSLSARYVFLRVFLRSTAASGASILFVYHGVTPAGPGSRSSHQSRKSKSPRILKTVERNSRRVVVVCRAHKHQSAGRLKHLCSSSIRVASVLPPACMSTTGARVDARYYEVQLPY